MNVQIWQCNKQRKIPYYYSKPKKKKIIKVRSLVKKRDEKSKNDQKKIDFTLLFKRKLKAIWNLKEKK